MTRDCCRRGKRVESRCQMRSDVGVRLQMQRKSRQRRLRLGISGSHGLTSTLLSGQGRVELFDLVRAVDDV